MRFIFIKDIFHSRNNITLVLSATSVDFFTFLHAEAAFLLIRASTHALFDHSFKDSNKKGHN
jgi:hypothetical protein